MLKYIPIVKMRIQTVILVAVAIHQIWVERDMENRSSTSKELELDMEAVWALVQSYTNSSTPGVSGMSKPVLIGVRFSLFLDILYNLIIIILNNLNDLT